MIALRQGAGVAGEKAAIARQDLKCSYKTDIEYQLI